MDTITHGIAGALIAKGVFRGDDMFAAKPMNRARILTWSLMLGAIFPDSDVFRDMFSSNRLLVVTWHRSITHSLLCLPLWALALAALTLWFARWRKWEPPSFLALTGIYAAGILSHIFLDLVTTFGTMIWSPLKWSRPAWDLLFIVDFTFAAILLIPQILSWVYTKREGLQLRALSCWAAAGLATLGIAAIARAIGAEISFSTILAIVVILVALFLLPAIRGAGVRMRLASWNRAGVIVAIAYICAALFAHHLAFRSVEKFASAMGLEVQSIAALPLPPSLFHWDGLVLTSQGVYEVRLDLSDDSSTQVDGKSVVAGVYDHRFYPSAAANPFIDEARNLPTVQKVLWFDRFPVMRFHKEGTEAIVEIWDARFPQIRSERAPFTYLVRFDEDGKILSQGWAP